jgi:hypothetical protein
VPDARNTATTWSSSAASSFTASTAWSGNASFIHDTRLSDSPPFPLDLRSRIYQAVGGPTGLDGQTATLRIRSSPGGPAHTGDGIAERFRGEAASHVLSSEADPEDPLDIADLLAARWSLEVDPPAVPWLEPHRRIGKAATMAPTHRPCSSPRSMAER